MPTNSFESRPIGQYMISPRNDVNGIVSFGYITHMTMYPDYIYLSTNTIYSEICERHAPVSLCHVDV